MTNHNAAQETAREQEGLGIFEVAAGLALGAVSVVEYVRSNPVLALVEAAGAVALIIAGRKNKQEASIVLDHKQPVGHVISGPQTNAAYTGYETTN